VTDISSAFPFKWITAREAGFVLANTFADSERVCPWEVSLEFAGFATLSAQCGCSSQVRHLARCELGATRDATKINPTEASREPLERAPIGGVLAKSSISSAGTFGPLNGLVHGRSSPAHQF